MDNSHRPSTFFTNIHTIEIPQSKMHASKEPEENESQVPTGHPKQNHTPKWLVPFAVVLIIAQIAGVILWFGYRQQVIVKAHINETISKLQLIEKHGYNVKGYYSQVNEQNKKMQSPWALVSLGSVKGVLATIDQEVSAQYSQLLDNEKVILNKKIANLEQELNDTSAYTYSSKTETLAYVQELKNKISKAPLSIQQVEQYEEGIDTREKKLNEELSNVMKEQFAQLELQMSKATYYDFPSHDKIEEYIQKTGGFNANHQASTKEIITQIKTIATSSTTVDAEVEAVKKNVVINNVTAATNEVDTLLAFFAQRNGYTNEISQLNQYKNNVAQFTLEKTKAYTSVQLQKKVDTELMPLLVVPRQSKVAAEAKERQERLAQQKKLEEEKGIPVPPLDAPKLVLIDIAKQRLYAYENGISIFDAPVPITTGARGFDTVTGQFAIYLKTTNFRMRSPFPGIFYDNVVQYWMPFFQGYGLHDANWRSIYGTMDYPDVGSHGCVNIPFDYVQRLYAWAEVGTTVIVR